MNTKTKSGVPIWTDAVFTIPTQATDTDKLTTRINTLVNIYVSEDWFKEDDWIFLKSWMLDKKNQINQVTFRALTISLENLKYIRDIILKNKKIQIIVFNNYTIQSDEAFNDFCDMIRQIKKINRIRISINELSTERLEQLKLSVDSSIKESELIHEPVYIAYSDDYIVEGAYKKRKFLIGMKEINFIKSDHIGWSFFNALKNSPALRHVSVQPAMLNHLNLRQVVDAIIQNKSITSVAICFADRSLMDRLFTADNITHVSVVGPFGKTTTYDTFTRPSLTSLTVETGFGEEPTFLYKIPNYTELKIISGSTKPSTAAEVLSTNTHVKKLHLIGGSHKKIEKMSTLMLEQLTTLSLDCVALKIDICQILKNSTSLTELSIRADGYMTQAVQNTSYDSIADILEVNSTLKSLTALIAPKDPIVFEKLAHGLKKNKTLTRLEVSVVDYHYYDLFAEALLENQTLTSLWLDGPEMFTQEHLAPISNMLRLNNTLISLTCSGINCWTDAILALKSNTSLQTLNLSSSLENIPNDQFLEALTQALENNMSLTAVSLSKRAMKTYQIPLQCQQVLRRNYLAYHRGIDGVYSLITMVALRPDAFTSMLPLEIWIMIFKLIKIPSCQINFAEKLVAALASHK